jgi:hypothetical protein
MTPIIEKGRTRTKKISFDWTSDAEGNASGVTAGVYSGLVDRVKVAHDPEHMPMAAYDIIILDEDGDDVACGELKDIAPVVYTVLSSTTCTLGAIADSALTFHVSNAGSGKKGKITVFLR